MSDLPDVAPPVTDEGSSNEMLSMLPAVVRVPEELRGWRYLYCYMKSVAGEYSRSVCVDLQE